MSIHNNATGNFNISNDFHTNSLKKPASNKLYSEWGSIDVKGSKSNKSVYESAKAHHNVRVNNVVIQGRVLSNFGNVLAIGSDLNNVSAHNHIDLVNSHANDLSSIFGHVNVKQYPDTQSTLGNITAHTDIDLSNSSAKNLLSKFGRVRVRQTPGLQSQISSITAHKEIEVNQTSVNGKIKSTFGTVVANQSTLAKVNASQDIDVINTSATALLSKFGHVVARQTDGTQRVISQIKAVNKIVTENCDIENLTLHVSQDKQALLDLKNTTVSGKIAIKVRDLLVMSEKTTYHCWFWFIGWSEKVQQTIPSNANKQFSLLVKGVDSLPKNISFEGFKEEEVTSQMTDKGILVTGRKQ